MRREHPPGLQARGPDFGVWGLNFDVQEPKIHPPPLLLLSNPKQTNPSPFLALPWSCLVAGITRAAVWGGRGGGGAVRVSNPNP